MKKNLIRVAFSIFNQLLIVEGLTQEYKPAGVLYETNYIKIELQYRLNPCPTEGIGRRSKYRLNVTRFTGRVANMFLNWKMDYYNCRNSITSETKFYNMSAIAGKGPIEDYDWTFEGYAIDSAYYDVTTSRSPDLTKPTYKFAESLAADSITTERKIICEGEKNITLAVKGGRLGREAQWIWYQDSVEGGGFARGNSIVVSPLKNTVYLVRAEGRGNTTATKKLSISVVKEQIPEPSEIIGPRFICQENILNLKVVDNISSTNAQWCWYVNHLSGDNLIGRGNTISIKPLNSTTYYVRGEGVCYTNPKSIFVMVGRPSSSPKSITSATNRKKYTLSVTDGTIGDNAKWVWYKKNCGNGRKIGTGASIIKRIERETDIFVRAEGDCDTSKCASITPEPMPRETFLNLGLVSSFRSSANDDISKALQRIPKSPIFSLTFGTLNEESALYLRAKFGLNFKTSKYASDSTNLLDYPTNSDTYYIFNGKVEEKRFGITAGFITGLGNTVFLQFGAGYGKRTLLWGVNEYSNQTNYPTSEIWAKNTIASFEGIEGEAGLILKIAMFNITLTSNSILRLGSPNSEPKIKAKLYYDHSASLGFIF